MAKRTAKADQTAALVVTGDSVSVPTALQVINEQIKSLKHIQDSVYKTPGKVQMASGTIDIKEEKELSKVVLAFANIQHKASSIEKAYETLGIESYPVVKVDGGTVSEWEADCKLRIQIIQHKDKLDELTALKKEWEELMDKEDRKALLMAKMAGKGLL